MAVLVGLQGCGKSSTEDAALAIYKKAKSLQHEGRVLDALREFDRLIDFKDTKVFTEADAALSKEGISIGSALESWTLKRMFEVKNRIIRQGRERHPDGNVTVPYTMNDAWGKPLMIEYSQGPKYSFVVISSGKDTKLYTDDDLKLYRRLRAGAKRGMEPIRGDSSRTLARKGDNSGLSESPSTREAVVDLKDLLKDR